VRRLVIAVVASLLVCLLPDAAGARGRHPHAASTAGAVKPVRAIPSDRFAQSVGVNLHIGYPDTPYADFDRVAARLREAGIRTVRDGLNVDKPWEYERFRALARSGIALTLIMGDPQGRYGTGPFGTLFSTLKRELPGAVSAVEGANEYDISGDPDWAAAVGAHQRRLFEAVKGDPATRGLQVLAPSFAHPWNSAQVGDLSRWSDAGNVHAYPGGRPAPANLDEVLGPARALAGPKPIIATETGYHNAVNTLGGHVATTERATAAYLPKLFLEYFRRGVPRTYAYELLDQHADPARTDAERAFGLLHNDFSPKPAFGAIKRLLSVVGDRGATFEPGALSLGLTGDTADVKSMLLQRRDGTYVLAAWHDLPLARDGADLRTPVRRVELQLGKRMAAGRVLSTDPTTPVTALGAASRVKLTLGAAPLLVEMRFGTAASASKRRRVGSRPRTRR